MSINAVLKVGKVAEVCVCYTGNILTSSIYNADYYQSVAYEVCKTGAHIIAIKDMAGLLKPLEVVPLMDALRAGIKQALGDANALPIHFHTHATSSGTIATTIAMAQYGCNIIDFCTASMADGTSQPSLNTFVAMMEGGTGNLTHSLTHLLTHSLTHSITHSLTYSLTHLTLR